MLSESLENTMNWNGDNQMLEQQQICRDLQLYTLHILLYMFSAVLYAIKTFGHKA